MLPMYRRPPFYVFVRKLDAMDILSLKYRMYLNQEDKRIQSADTAILLDFINRVELEEFNQKLDEVAGLIYYAQKIIFIGIGNSGILAKYGARYFSGVGKLAQYIDDPFYPVPPGYYDASVIIALSVSGESNCYFSIFVWCS